MEEIKEFDCFGDGCGKCEVCEYLSFREMAEGCAPGGSTIERNEKVERYLKRKDEEIDLAVSKERETFMDTINQLKLVHSMELDSVSCKSLEEFVKWATNRKDLINTK